MANTLYSLAPEPKTLHIMAEAGHNDLSRNGGEVYWLTWRQLLTQTAVQPNDPPSP
jgi:hypothetical protein